MIGPLWTWRPRGGLYERLDERARLAFAACGVAALLATFDPLALGALAAVAALVVRAARVRLVELRRFLLFAGVVIVFLVLLTWWTRGGTPAARRAHALAQSLRMLGLVLFTCVLPFTIDPGRYGLVFRRLGLPDSLAFAVELAFRFVPALTERFQRTVQAQAARGLELEARGAGPVARLRRLVPLWVPVLLDSLIAGEDLADAMDLRAFGTRPRTWSGRTRWGWPESVVLAAGLGMVLLALGAG